MKWFRVFNDTRRQPGVLRAEKALGEGRGYGRFVKLMEVIAAHGGSGADFRPVLDVRRPPTDLDWLAGELSVTRRELNRTLEIFAGAGLIEGQQWKQRIVSVPGMKAALDSWASAQKPDRKRRNSLQVPCESPASNLEDACKPRESDLQMTSLQKKKKEVEAEEEVDGDGLADLTGLGALSRAVGQAGKALCYCEAYCKPAAAWLSKQHRQAELERLSGLWLERNHDFELLRHPLAALKEAVPDLLEELADIDRKDTVTQ